MAGINLTKGQRTDVALQRFGVGLGWDPNPGMSAHAFDLDACAFLVGADGKCPQPAFFVFYNNAVSPDGAVKTLGDNQGGEGEGDDETLEVDLGKLDARIQQIVFTVTIHEAEQRRQNFGQVRNSFIRVYDASNGAELCKYELDEDFSTTTALEFGRLYKRGDAWRFEAMGIPGTGGLEGFVAKYS